MRVIMVSVGVLVLGLAVDLSLFAQQQAGCQPATCEDRGVLKEIRKTVATSPDTFICKFEDTRCPNATCPLFRDVAKIRNCGLPGHVKDHCCVETRVTVNREFLKCKCFHEEKQEVFVAGCVLEQEEADVDTTVSHKAQKCMKTSGT
jgi:hypothetical protein